ncbi:MAG: STAS domain-containing protein [Alphaproteobacteria bacterium]|nr:STAS domain-containing protein [Alphaproteobacteria bacterium]
MGGIMEFSTQSQGADMVFVLTGRMTFKDHKLFREILLDVAKKTFQRAVFDLNRLDFIDSFGVGMLLIVKDAAENRSKSVVLRKPQGQVEHMVQIAKLAKLFTIE